jgi:hypothetical protein
MNLCISTSSAVPLELHVGFLVEHPDLTSRGA